MAKRAPRFEIVHTDGGWHARFRAANGRIVWVTENYTRWSAANNAIAALEALGDLVDVRDIDERTVTE